MPSFRKTAKHAARGSTPGTKSMQPSTRIAPAAPALSPGGPAPTKVNVNVGTSRTKQGNRASGLAIATVSKPTFKLTVFGPLDSKSDTSFRGNAMLDLLDLVRQRHGVKVELGTPSDNCITITGAALHGVHAAHVDIRVFTRTLGLPDQHQLFMVLAPVGKTEKITLACDPSYPELARSSFKDKPAGIGVEDIDEKLMMQQTTMFRVHFEKLARLIGSVPSALHMQVHLGRLLSSAQHGNSSATSEDAAVQLDHSITNAAADGKVVFDRRIGNSSMFGAMQQQVFRFKDFFYPCSSVLENILDVKPQLFIVGIMDCFRFELQIGEPGSAPDKQFASLSNLRVFQTLGSEGKADLVVACPDRDIDWKIETVPELAPEEIPSSIRALIEGISVAYAKEYVNFPKPIIHPGLSKEYRVKQLFGKTVWTVGCKGTRYLLELSLYHKFSGPCADEESRDQALMGISMLSHSWEEALKPPAIKGGHRELGTNWERLFRPNTGRGAEGDGVGVFLKLVSLILNLWGRANAEAGRDVASSPSAANVPPAISSAQAKLSVDDVTVQSSPARLVSGLGILVLDGPDTLTAVLGKGCEEGDEENLLVFD